MGGIGHDKKALGGAHGWIRHDVGKEEALVVMITMAAVVLDQSAPRKIQFGAYMCLFRKFSNTIE